jgi:hypothetical protein
MNVFEKFYAFLAIIFATGLLIGLIYLPELRLLPRLIPLSLLGLIINVGLIFIVLRDIFSRQFGDQRSKYFWMALVLFFWPSILIYLPKYGFRPRSS